MAESRFLIVNADDFGLSPGINRGIIEAHEHGIVTSTSLLVRWPAATEAGTYSREHPNLSLGLHIDLGEWAYRDGTWVPLYEVVRRDDLTAIADEASCQLDIFRSLVGRVPTHIDSHQHVHLREPVKSILIDIANKVGVPLRGCSSEVYYCGDFYGQTTEGSPLPDVISVTGLLKILAALPPGIIELGCHPGMGIDFDMMYRSERMEELRVLCHPHVREVIGAMGIELISFDNITACSIGPVSNRRTG